MSPSTDALREGLEALDIDAVEEEQQELRDALDAARAALLEAREQILAAVALVAAARASINQLCTGEEIDTGEVWLALEYLGGSGSESSGPLDDLADTAGNLESAASDIGAVLGNEPQQLLDAAKAPSTVAEVLDMQNRSDDEDHPIVNESGRGLR